MSDGERLHDGIWWVRLNLAARRCGTTMAKLRVMAAAGEIQSLETDGAMWITRGTVGRLKRENATMRSVARAAAKPKNSLVETRRDGVSIYQQSTPSLPMTHGRMGKGWKGWPGAD